MNIKKTSSFVLLFALGTPLLAEPTTAWDSMNRADGVVIITLKTGKTVKRAGTAVFTDHDVSFASTTVSILRRDVKEVVIRESRKSYDGWMLTGPLVLGLTIAGAQDDPGLLLLLPIGIGMAAVTGPPWLIYEGVRRLKPTKILYRVVP